MKLGGYDWGPGWRRLLKAAGPKHAARVFGIFIKFLEVGAKQPCDTRWLLLDPTGIPGNPRTFREFLGLAEQDVAKAIEVLTHQEVAWLEWMEWNPVSQECREIPVIPGSGLFGISSSKDSTKKEKPSIESLLRFQEIGFPKGMDTPQIREAIIKWLEYKKRRGEGYQLPEREMTELLNQDHFGGDPSRFVAAVSYSIGNNYAGCIPAPAKGGRRAIEPSPGSKHDPQRPVAPL
jgi:hypothetical protein